ncbi:MAG: peptidoglycan-binding protein [Elainellaceae cyanobacterium]
MNQDASQLKVHDVDAWSSSSMSNCSSLLLLACLSYFDVSPGLAISVSDGGDIEWKQRQFAVATVNLAPESDSATEDLSLRTQPYRLAQSSPSSADYPDSVLRLGVYGRDVAEAQALLSELGYYDANIDGIYGEQTQIAVSEFQSNVGLPPDGQIDQQTWQQLQATRNLAQSDSSGVSEAVLEPESSASNGVEGEQNSEANNANGTETEETSDGIEASALANPEEENTADVNPDTDTNTIANTVDASQSSGESSLTDKGETTPSSNVSSQFSWLQWLLLLVVIGIASGGLYQIGRWRGKQERQQGGLSHGRSPTPHSSSHPSSAKSEPKSTNSQLATVSQETSNGITDSPTHPSGNGEGDRQAEPVTLSDTSIVESHNGAGEVAKSPLAADTIPIEATTRLAKVNIVQELVNDLHTPDPSKRRKAIWELGQRGSSEAIQPLSDLLIDSDSSQRSLILAAMSEIGMRSLKPLNRALIISMQDENPDVRKNAIRDVTRVCDLVAQISQVLHHAAYDENQEVQETAQWALKQIDRIRGNSDLGHLPPSDVSQSTSESLPSASSDPPETH